MCIDTNKYLTLNKIKLHFDQNKNVTYIYTYNYTFIREYKLQINCKIYMINYNIK